MSKPRDTYTVWQEHLKHCKDKLAKGEKLTKEEEEYRFFIEEKLADYASDVEIY